MKNKKILNMLSALSHETRLSIFRLLTDEGSEGMPAGVIADILQIPNTTLSFHLSLLNNAGLVKQKREGRVIKYIARKKTLKKLFKNILEDKPEI